MNQSNTIRKPWYRRLTWENVIFLIVTPIIALIFAPIRLYLHGLSWEIIGLFVFLAVATGISITGGYHRLFAHRTYDAHPWLKLFYLLFGAATFQGSALKWCSDHRRHHRHVDSENDPYDIKRGFIYAHIGWLFLEDNPKFRGVFESDLAKDPWIAFQHKYYIPLAFGMGFGFPWAVGAFLGDAMGGLLFAGVVRIVLVHHSTFLINSFCHMFGTRPYSDKVSARDSALIAFFTYGEGYHNFHHRFQNDYRNGIKWYHWDPTKWAIQFFSWFGLTGKLRRVPSWEIMKARFQMDQKRLLQYGVTMDKWQPLTEKVEKAQHRLKEIREEYTRLRKDVQQKSQQRYRLMKAELKMAKVEFKAAYSQWLIYVKTYRSLPAMQTA